MKITVLGSGTSSGIPVISCTCEVCQSQEPKNKRMRPSIMVEVPISGENRVIIIDTGPDFRVQALTHKIPRIDAVFYTHSHADHIFGLDDLRMYNFKQKEDIHAYADSQTSHDLIRIFNYCFVKDPEYEGGGIPSLKLNTLRHGVPFYLSLDTHKEVPIYPLAIFHGKKIITGYKIKNFAYFTDCNGIPEETKKYLADLKYIIISGLRHRPHKTHFTIEQAITCINSLPVTHGYLTHIAHEIDHEKTMFELSQGNIFNQNIELAYDGLTFTCKEF